jgi:transcription elongation factor Elf1
MRAFENLLAPGSTELPECRCGAEMRRSATKPLDGDTDIRIFRCDVCGHEFQLMVWKAAEPRV